MHGLGIAHRYVGNQKLAIAIFKLFFSVTIVFSLLFYLFQSAHADLDIPRDTFFLLCCLYLVDCLFFFRMSINNIYQIGYISILTELVPCTRCNNDSLLQRSKSWKSNAWSGISRETHRLVWYYYDHCYYSFVISILHFIYRRLYVSYPVLHDICKKSIITASVISSAGLTYKLVVLLME